MHVGIPDVGVCFHLYLQLLYYSVCSPSWNPSLHFSFTTKNANNSTSRVSWPFVTNVTTFTFWLVYIHLLFPFSTGFAQLLQFYSFIYVFTKVDHTLTLCVRGIKTKFNKKHLSFSQTTFVVSGRPASRSNLPSTGNRDGTLQYLARYFVHRV